MPRIAYLGPEGTFTEAALLQMVAGAMIPAGRVGTLLDVVPVPYESAGAALEAVRTTQAEYACVPIENSIEGSVLPTLDGLADGPVLQVYAEHTLDIAFAIVTRNGVSSDDIETVAAFPVAAAQVRHWLAAELPGARVVPAYSNAAAAQDVANGLADAGVSTALAAQRYGVATLAADIVDEANARTRFVLVGLPAPPPARTGADRTSVVLRLENVPGALVSAMSEFSIRDIDLIRIESRPTRTELGTYKFFLDCVGHIADDAVAEALKALHRRCADVRYLGSWPTGVTAGAAPPELNEAAQWLAALQMGGTAS